MWCQPAQQAEQVSGRTLHASVSTSVPSCMLAEVSGVKPVWFLSSPHTGLTTDDWFRSGSCQGRQIYSNPITSVCSSPSLRTHLAPPPPPPPLPPPRELDFKVMQCARNRSCSWFNTCVESRPKKWGLHYRLHDWGSSARLKGSTPVVKLYKMSGKTNMFPP